MFWSQIKSVKDHVLENRMESFFLAETTKYLYLMFDSGNFIHSTGGSGSVVNTPSGPCILDAGMCVVGLQWLIDYTRTHLMALCPGLPRWVGTRKVKPIWMLLKQETVTGSGCFLTYLLPYLSFPLRIDPLRFQVGCCKRRLNLALVFLC